MIFDVWDSESANIVGAFESKGEALDALGRALADEGSSYVSILVLGVEDDAGDSTMIATGPDLVRLVEDHLGSPSVSQVSTGASASQAVATEADIRRRR